ncbi:dihydrofolate reductase family protein [Micromonospora sp. M12]
MPWGEEPRSAHRSSSSPTAPPAAREGWGTSFTYVTDGVASAVEQARAAAGGKDVAVAGGGSLVRQVLKAGLLDELELHVVPVVLGTGLRLFNADLDLGDKEAIELAPIRFVHTPQVTHIRYAVRGRARSCSTTGAAAAARR